MIRPIRADDIPRLRELQEGFDWTFGKEFIDALVYVDEKDVPQAFIGAWKRAEVHIAADKKFSTPGARFVVLNELQDTMQRRLAASGFAEMVTWFDCGVDRFFLRLSNSGWVKSMKTSWHRRQHGS